VKGGKGAKSGTSGGPTQKQRISIEMIILRILQFIGGAYAKGSRLIRRQYLDVRGSKNTGRSNIENLILKKRKKGRGSTGEPKTAQQKKRLKPNQSIAIQIDLPES